VSQETKQELYQALDGLRGHLKGALDFRVVENVSVETDLIRGNLDAFWFDFADEGARNVYLEDAEHQAVGARLVEHLDGGIEGVTVFDFVV
jgi:hypothetical protein